VPKIEKSKLCGGERLVGLTGGTGQVVGVVERRFLGLRTVG